MVKKITENCQLSIEAMKPCIYNPTEDKLLQIRNDYTKNDLRSIYVEEINNEIIGVIGIELRENNEIEILHISVNEQYRKMNIGRKMVNYIFDIFPSKKIYAETDKDAVDFYKKCGFTITNLGEKYKGTERYQCIVQR